MFHQDFIFSSESVTEGHPDKVADQISDAVLDSIIKDDPNCRVACETLITRNRVILSAEIKSTISPDFERIIKDTLLSIGYDDESKGFDANNCDIDLYIEEQSADISMGVDKIDSEIIGAGDQGLMFGYATKENDNLTMASYPNEWWMHVDGGAGAPTISSTSACCSRSGTILATTAAVSSLAERLKVIPDISMWN